MQSSTYSLGSDSSSSFALFIPLFPWEPLTLLLVIEKKKIQKVQQRQLKRAAASCLHGLDETEQREL